MSGLQTHLELWTPASVHAEIDLILLNFTLCDVKGILTLCCVEINDSTQMLFCHSDSHNKLNINLLIYKSIHNPNDNGFNRLLFHHCYCYYFVFRILVHGMVIWAVFTHAWADLTNNNIFSLWDRYYIRRKIDDQNNNTEQKSNNANFPYCLKTIWEQCGNRTPCDCRKVGPEGKIIFGKYFISTLFGRPFIVNIDPW